jgi:hypothetical protein
MPTDATERASGIIEALRHPRLYEALFLKYAGQSLPTMLANVLNRSYGISESAAQRAEQIFRESAEFAKVLKNGIIQTEQLVELASDPSAHGKPTGIDVHTETTERKVGESQGPMSFFHLAAGVQLQVPEVLMMAFATGEFGDQMKALCSALKEWEKDHLEMK